MRRSLASGAGPPETGARSRCLASRNAMRRLSRRSRSSVIRIIATAIKESVPWKESLQHRAAAEAQRRPGEGPRAPGRKALIESCCPNARHASHCRRTGRGDRVPSRCPTRPPGRRAVKVRSMHRGAKPENTKVEAKLPVASKSPKKEAARGRQLKKRLAEALE